jgi:hypothetical protein
MTQAVERLPSMKPWVQSPVSPEKEKVKTLLKEMKDNTDKLKDMKSSWIRRLNIVIMPILLNAIHRLKAILNKIPLAFFFLSKIGKKSWSSYGLSIIPK